MALLLALLAICPSVATTRAGQAEAADKAYGLYQFTGDQISPLPGVDGVEFTALGALEYVDSVDGLMHVGPCALSADGSVWYSAENNYKWEGMMIPRNDASMQNMGSLHRAECYTDLSILPYGGNLTRMKSGPAPYSVRGTSSLVSADRMGTLWYTATPTPQLLPDSKEYSVRQVAQLEANGTDASSRNPFNILVLAEPRAQQGATVAAVPTTGAPSSDLIAPAALLAVGMVGGGLMIRKKKDRGRA